MSSERASSRSSESLRPAERLRRRQDYRECYQRGRRRFGTHLTVFFNENQLAHPRLGMTVSRKVGKAVVRSRLKRAFREIYRRWPRRTELPGLDLVIHAKPSSASATFAELRTDLETQLSALAGRRRGGRTS